MNEILIVFVLICSDIICPNKKTTRLGETNEYSMSQKPYYNFEIGFWEPQTPLNKTAKRNKPSTKYDSFDIGYWEPEKYSVDNTDRYKAMTKSDSFEIGYWDPEKYSVDNTEIHKPKAKRVIISVLNPGVEILENNDKLKKVEQTLFQRFNKEYSQPQINLISETENAIGKESFYSFEIDEWKPITFSGNHPEISVNIPTSTDLSQKYVSQQEVPIYKRVSKYLPQTEEKKQHDLHVEAAIPMMTQATNSFEIDHWKPQKNSLYEFRTSIPKMSSDSFEIGYWEPQTLSNYQNEISKIFGKLIEMAMALRKIYINPNQIVRLEKVSDLNEKGFLMCIIGRLRFGFEKISDNSYDCCIKKFIQVIRNPNKLKKLCYEYKEIFTGLTESDIKYLINTAPPIKVSIYNIHVKKL